MSDLTPAEQARAARWVKDWLLKCEFVESETAQDAITALGFYIDKLDPLETVGSLLVRLAAQERGARRYRAERDEARGELARLRVLMRAATATPREHWLGGDHSNQTPYPVVRE